MVYKASIWNSFLDCDLYPQIIEELNSLICYLPDVGTSHLCFKNSESLFSPREGDKEAKVQRALVSQIIPLEPSLNRVYEGKGWCLLAMCWCGLSLMWGFYPHTPVKSPNPVDDCLCQNGESVGNISAHMHTWKSLTSSVVMLLLLALLWKIHLFRITHSFQLGTGNVTCIQESGLSHFLFWFWCHTQWCLGLTPGIRDAEDWTWFPCMPTLCTIAPASSFFLKCIYLGAGSIGQWAGHLPYSRSKFYFVESHMVHQVCQE